MRRPALIALLLLLAACQFSFDGTGLFDGEFLAPDDYEQELKALENEIFANPVGEGLMPWLHQLADVIEGEEGKLPKIFARELRVLGPRHRMSQDAHDLRQQWMRIRSSLFVDASWYRWEHSPNNPGPQHSVCRVPDRADARLFNAIHRIARDAKDGRRACQKLPVPAEATPEYQASVDYGVVIAQWEEWSPGWQTRLARSRRFLPRAEEFDDPALRVAQEKLDRALDWLGDVPMGDGGWATPFRFEWEARFDAADAEIRSAYEGLPIELLMAR